MKLVFIIAVVISSIMSQSSHSLKTHTSLKFQFPQMQMPNANSNANESALKIQRLEATVNELRAIKNSLLEKLGSCQQRLNFSQMTIQNTGNNPCFKQDVNMN